MYDRSKSIGASDAVHIQAGDWAALYDRKTSSDAPDYGLAARIGHELEALNRELFVQETGRELVEWHDDDDPVTMGDYGGKKTEWMKYLPDGVVHSGELRLPFEAKAINMMWKPHFLLRKYMPQLQHAMRVMQAPSCFFSVIYLNTKYEVATIQYDPAYDKALLDREILFEWHLRKGIRPPEKKGRKWI
jgi:hypothetical protein